MITELKFVNPITNDDDKIILKYPQIDYFTFKQIKNYNNDNDIIIILNNILKDLDCTIEYPCGRLHSINYPNYNYNLSRYYFYIIKLTNQFIYNKYINKLIELHINNIIYEFKNPIINKQKDKSKCKSKKIINKFIKAKTYDLFTNKEIYVYINNYTKEEIKSEDPNLLEKLNSKHKNNKNNRNNKHKTGVPIEYMTFSFNKNK